MSRSFVLLAVVTALLVAAADAACSNFYTCNTCTGGSNSGTCGWAADQNQCLAGTIVGPNFGSSSDWMFTGVDCICSNYYSCSLCTANSNCGWTSNYECVASTSIGAMSWCNSINYSIVSSSGLGVGIIMIIILVPVIFLIAVTTTLCIICNRRRAVIVAPVQTYATYGVAQPIAGGATVGVVGY